MTERNNLSKDNKVKNPRKQIQLAVRARDEQSELSSLSTTLPSYVSIAYSQETWWKSQLLSDVPLFEKKETVFDVDGFILLSDDKILRGWKRAQKKVESLQNVREKLCCLL